MPVMCIVRAPGATVADYDRIRKHLKWETCPPEGGMAHFISFDRGVAFEVDVWESEEAFRSYYERSFVPAARRFHIALEEPEVKDLHNLALAPRMEAFVLHPGQVPAQEPVIHA